MGRYYRAYVKFLTEQGQKIEDAYTSSALGRAQEEVALQPVVDYPSGPRPRGFRAILESLRNDPIMKPSPNPNLSDPFHTYGRGAKDRGGMDLLDG